MCKFYIICNVYIALFLWIISKRFYSMILYLKMKCFRTSMSLSPFLWQYVPHDGAVSWEHKSRDEVFDKLKWLIQLMINTLNISDVRMKKCDVRMKRCDIGMIRSYSFGNCNFINNRNIYSDFKRFFNPLPKNTNLCKETKQA